MKLIPCGKCIGCRLSPPARGAWIEISLKVAHGTGQTVAPRTGGVD